jgi:hypothetical protein
MKRFIFAVALAGLTTSSTHALAQERVATREVTNKSARAASAAHIETQPKSPAPASAPVSKSENGLTLVAPSTSGMVDGHPGQDLSDVHQNTSKTSTDSGADAHAVAMTVAASKVPRLVATPRLLRRMNADAVVAKLASAFHACYAEDPSEKTADSAVVRVEIAPSGAVDRSTVEGGAKTTPQVTACILSVATTGKFNPPGGIGTAVLIQVRTR